MNEEDKIKLIVKCSELLKEYNSRIATIYDIKNNLEYSFITQDALNYNVIRCNKIIFEMFYNITQFLQVEDIKVLQENNVISESEYDVFNNTLQLNPIIKDVEINEVGSLITNYNILAKAIINILNVLPTLSE